MLEAIPWQQVNRSNYYVIRGPFSSILLPVYPPEELRKRYKEPTRSQTYVDRCILIAECCITLERADTENETKNKKVRHYYQTEADYLLDHSYYHFILESALVQPSLVFCKDKLDDEGYDEETLKSYILEVFDSTLPRYRMKNGSVTMWSTWMMKTPPGRADQYQKTTYCSIRLSTNNWFDLCQAQNEKAYCWCVGVEGRGTASYRVYDGREAEAVWLAGEGGLGGGVNNRLSKRTMISKLITTTFIAMNKYGTFC